MSVVRFEINLDKSRDTYFCGETGTGIVIIDLEKEMKIRGHQITAPTDNSHMFTNVHVSVAIQLKIVGKAGVPTTTELNNTGKNIYEIEIYKQYLTDFAGVPSNTILPPGTHRYSFRFVLPWGIPSTFFNTDKSGYIHYKVKAAIRRGLRDNKCESPMKVKCPLDLNTISGLTMPVHASTTKMVNIGLYDYLVKLEIYLPFSGYVSNQNVHADFAFENQSKHKINLKAYIIQIIEYRRNDGVLRANRYVICRQRVAETDSPGSLTSSTDIRLPDIQDTFINGTKPFRVSYRFEMKAKISGTSKEVCVGVPITVGSIPLITPDNRTQKENHPSLPPKESEVPHPTQTQSRGASSAASTSSQCSLPLPEMFPPPTYEEATGGMINEMGIKD